MGGNLERFERLSRAAKERERSRAKEEQRADQQQWDREYGAGAEARSRQTPGHLAGPPAGCHDCYKWRRYKLGGWGWVHGPAINPQTRPWSVWEDDEDPEPCEFCTHACHGPSGEPLPVIALAAC